jgi:hypothetical protein
MIADHLTNGAARESACSGDAGYPRLPPPASARRHGGRFIALALLAICGFVGVILGREGDRSPVASLAPHLSPGGFVADERLAPMVSFSAPEIGPSPVHYQARVREESHERWDTLTFGGASADELLFRVTLRSAKASAARPSLFVQLAKQSAEIGAAVIHATNPQIYATERGAIEWADMTLSAPSRERPCLGFRFARVQDVDLSGLACGPRGSPLSLVALGHLVERLSPTNSGIQAGLGVILKGGDT